MGISTEPLQSQPEEIVLAVIGSQTSRNPKHWPTMTTPSSFNAYQIRRIDLKFTTKFMCNSIYKI